MIDNPVQPEPEKPRPATPVPSCLLRLYVCGQTANSLQAIRNLRMLMEGELANVYRLEIIDVLQQPSLAEREHILATPTLIRVYPTPVRRIIGDLSNRERVLASLELTDSSGER